MSTVLQEYHVRVDNILENGHPIQFIDFNLNAACDRFDWAVDKYPSATVRMFRLIEEEIKVVLGVVKIAKQESKEIKCPKGHHGLDWNKTPVIFNTGTGMLTCSICGLRWQSETEKHVRE